MTINLNAPSYNKTEGVITHRCYSFNAHMTNTNMSTAANGATRDELAETQQRLNKLASTLFQTEAFSQLTQQCDYSLKNVQIEVTNTFGQAIMATFKHIHPSEETFSTEMPATLESKDFKGIFAFQQNPSEHGTTELGDLNQKVTITFNEITNSESQGISETKTLGKRKIRSIDDVKSLGDFFKYLFSLFSRCFRRGGN